MASLSLPLFLLGFLLLSGSSLLGFCLHVDGQQVQGHHVVRVQSLLPKTVCSSPTGTNHTGLKIIHRHGPCSPINRRQMPSPREILRQDVSRVRSLLSRQVSTVSQPEKLRGSLSTIPAHLGRSLGTANYIVTVGFGTPKRDLSLVFDTGSDLTWVQCQPCVGYCYQQQEPIFDPTQSTSYYNISCTATDCPLLKTATGSAGRCSGSSCVYGIQYGDNSYSVGFFARDTLTLTSSDVFSNFKFGCGQKNRGLFGRSAGLLGLGRDKVSVVSQASQKYGGVFSYCLPSRASSVGYLNFGADASSSTAKLTPMLSDSTMSSFYFLDLIAISVGGQQLGISPSIFATPGTLIDSGTVISRLPPTAYASLRSAFRQQMTKYQTSPALSILDTCYNFTGYTTVSIPAVSLHFRGGASLNVDSSGILFVANISQACLAFAGNSDPGSTAIIGNMQQQTYKVVYDTSKGVIGFGAGGCS